MSCTGGLLREVGQQSAARGTGIHAHASENRSEIAAVRERAGMDNIEYLHACGMLSERAVIAHCIHLSPAETKLLAQTGAHVAHCPSSNLKLASGIALVPELIAAGVSVALGADGAPCNNNLDGFLELRLAALLHKPRLGPRTLPAPEAVRLATANGARALGLAGQIGELTVGARGDVIAVDVSGHHIAPAVNPWSVIAYAARSTDVRHVAVDGALVVRDRVLTTLDLGAVKRNARASARRLFAS